MPRTRKVKKPWHSGTHHVRSKKVRDQANADPNTRCWRCGHTLAEIRMTKPHAKWQAGHIHPGQVNGILLPECSPCNGSDGARRGNRTRANAKRRTPRTW
jgi:hypothetical protein